MTEVLDLPVQSGGLLVLFVVLLAQMGSFAGSLDIHAHVGYRIHGQGALGLLLASLDAASVGLSHRGFPLDHAPVLVQYYKNPYLDGMNGTFIAVPDEYSPVR